MDELEALKILRQERESVGENIAERGEERRPPLPRAVLIIFIILGYILSITLNYTAAVHPLDRTVLKMAVLQNYSVTITVSSSFSTVQREVVQVDGNVSYSNGDYYETVNGVTYRYYEWTPGMWYKEREMGSSDGISSNLITTLLNKDNYNTPLFGIGKMKLRNGVYADGLKDVTAETFLGNLTIKGKLHEGITVYKVEISFSGFGMQKLKLPEVKNPNYK